jgi:uncharacterized protein
MTDTTIDDMIEAPRTDDAIGDPVDAAGPADTGAEPGAAAPDGGAAPDGPHDPDTDDMVAGTARRALRWLQVLMVGVVCFGLWLVLDAPTLLRSAEASRFGARRTVAIELLRPLSSVDTALGLSHVVSGTDRVLGRTGTGVVQLSRSVTHKAHRAGRHGALRTAPATAATSSSTPAVAPDGFPQLPTPTNVNPLRVLSVGDSLGVDLGNPLVNDLVMTGVVDAAADAHIDTGLSRPDYFDWPAELRNDLARYSPQVVVVFLGANDPQNMVVAGNAVAFGTAEWSIDYGQRVDDFAKEATDTGARVILVGMPPMADAGLSAAVQVLNQRFAAASRRPGVTYFPSWPVLSDPSGAFETYLPDTSGNEVQVREPDGTHITPAGADRLAKAIMVEMERALAIHLQS